MHAVVGNDSRIVRATLPKDYVHGNPEGLGGTGDQVEHGNGGHKRQQFSSRVYEQDRPSAQGLDERTDKNDGADATRL